jgi:hypothetical protein
MSDPVREAMVGGQFTFPGTSLTVHRIGYGAMQLAGPGVWGQPRRFNLISVGRLVPQERDHFLCIPAA